MEENIQTNANFLQSETSPAEVSQSSNSNSSIESIFAAFTWLPPNAARREPNADGALPGRSSSRLSLIHYAVTRCCGVSVGSVKSDRFERRV